MTLALPIAEPVLLVLAFVRVTGVMLLAPLFGHASVPMRVRAAVAFGVALLVAPGAMLGAELPAVLGLAVATELLIGLSIGFVTSLVFASLSLMAELVAVQGGLGAAAVVDPSSEMSSVIVASLLRVFGLAVFLAIGGHHEVIRALWVSFERLPLGTSLAPASFGAVAHLGTDLFETGLRLAAPLTIVLFVANLVIGALGRTIPQLNLISVQLPAQIGLTLLLLALGAGAFFDALAHGFDAGLAAGLRAVLGEG